MDNVAPAKVPITGATLATVTVLVVLETRPCASVTVSVTVYTPCCAYVCDAATPVPVLPSPNAQSYEVIASPSGSLDPSALIATALPSTPTYGPSSAATAGRKPLSTSISIWSGSSASMS